MYCQSIILIVLQILKAVEGFYGALREIDPKFDAYFTRIDLLHITLAVVEAKSGEDLDIPLWVPAYGTCRIDTLLVCLGAKRL